MKKIIVLLLFASMNLFIQAQTSKPCPTDFHVKVKATRYSLNTDSLITVLSKWQFATSVNAFSVNLKTGTLNALTSVGIGMIKSAYKLKSDQLTVYKTYTFGGMLLIGDTQQTPLFKLPNATIGENPPEADYGIMVVGGYGPISVGPTYFLVSKDWLLNIQATFTF